jgi:hypothetical protein
LGEEEAEQTELRFGIVFAKLAGIVNAKILPKLGMQSSSTLVYYFTASSRAFSTTPNGISLFRRVYLDAWINLQHIG